MISTMQKFGTFNLRCTEGLVSEKPEVGIWDRIPAGSLCDFRKCSWVKVTDEDIKALIYNFEILNKEVVGEYKGYEFLRKESSGESLVLLSYLLKFDRQPFRVIFVFYKPEENWKIFSVKLDDKADTELQRKYGLY